MFDIITALSLVLAAGAVVAGRYELERPLGQGGMGVVWAARHTVTKKRVALKFLRGPAAVLRPDMRRRFLREARAASAVIHPNLIEVHDVFELDEQVPVMVMELLEGETLGQKIAREGALGLAETCSILLPVVSAVGTAHAAGVVHRDLKPDNVFLSAKSSGAKDVRVLDFGIAKLVGADFAATETGNITETGSMLGTPCYMSPEQSFGEKDIDHRADVWSLGVMIYECLTGARPVDGDSIGQVVKRLMTEGIVPIGVIAPHLPPQISGLVDRMLSRERNERPGDLREVLAVLEPFSGTAAPSFGPARSERESVPSDSGKVVIGSPSADTSAQTEESGSNRAPRPELQTASPHTFTAEQRSLSKGLRLTMLVGSVAGSIGLLIALSPPTTKQSPKTAATQVASVLPPAGGAVAQASRGGLRPPVTDLSAIERAVAPREAAPASPVSAVASTAPALISPSRSQSKKVGSPRSAPAAGTSAEPVSAPSVSSAGAVPSASATTSPSPRPRFAAEPPF